ncbi:uncharacterized protein IWZ02DRAFT_276051 [Phyllosticta citriasiana]|uniref:uncharacterized protein n=1 Tax=Phyllosticta citriasiana TaxID=595635 RepID=UPI0030FDE57D
MLKPTARLVCSLLLHLPRRYMSWAPGQLPMSAMVRRRPWVASRPDRDGLFFFFFSFPTLFHRRAPPCTTCPTAIKTVSESTLQSSTASIEKHGCQSTSMRVYMAQNTCHPSPLIVIPARPHHSYNLCATLSTLKFAPLHAMPKGTTTAPPPSAACLPPHLNGIKVAFGCATSHTAVAL